MNIKGLLERYNEFLFSEGFIIDQQLGIIDDEAITEFLAQKQVKKLTIPIVSNIPTFDEWLVRFYSEPEIKKMYKTKLSSKEFSESELLKKYNRAYKGCC